MLPVFESRLAQARASVYDQQAGTRVIMSNLGFMHKYYDWAAFETFVKELYEEDGEVIVERDVTEVDRYNAKRQIDVKITRRTRFHTLVTLVECKRWKEPVGRDRIDVLSSSVEALGANKGAIFTTTGFEEGAVAYAKGKGIDLFVVRDLASQEWGLPGRHVILHFHTWAAEFRNLSFPNVQAISLVDDNPGTINLDIRLDREMAKDPNLDLFSVKTGARGPNLVGILADAHGLVLRALSQRVNLIDDGNALNLELKSACEIDLSGTDYRQLRLPTVAVRLERIKFEFLASVNQSELKFDRGADLDFAVVVESYVADQRLIAHRRAGDTNIHFESASPGDQKMEDVLRNGSLLKVCTLPWVGLGNALPDKRGAVAELIRVLVDVVDGKPRLTLCSEPLPTSLGEAGGKPLKV